MCAIHKGVSVSLMTIMILCRFVTDSCRFSEIWAGMVEQFEDSRHYNPATSNKSENICVEPIYIEFGELKAASWTPVGSRNAKRDLPTVRI